MGAARHHDLQRAHPPSIYTLPRRSFRIAAVLAVCLGIAAAAAYYVQGLTLSHYDAKAHLVVSRRVLDSMRPGWMQIGAVWLPLPHLLNLIPVQVDWFYRTGLSAVAFSIVGFVIGALSLWALVARATGSTAAAWGAFAVFAAHPDVLYLQATPMTESLLMGLCLFGIYLTWRSAAEPHAASAWPAGVTLALACVTRYEAWGITLAALILSGVALVRAGARPSEAAARIAKLAAFPAAAVLAFAVLSHATVGTWLVTGGFYQIDSRMYHRPTVTLGAVWFGLRMLNGQVMTALGVLAMALVLIQIARRRSASHLLVILSLAACAALPLYAFWNGHPFRIRYMVPLTMVLATVTGLGISFVRHRTFAAAVVVLTALIETPPFSHHSPMLVEAQRDGANVLGRQHVAKCLVSDYDKTPILASMGSLAPFMQETARAGLSIRQFLHEGIGDLWSDSLTAARRHAGWVLIEEEAEGGDVLAHVRDRAPGFLAGFQRFCEGGGVALYRRIETP